MAKFIYRMQNILDIKMRLETQAKTAYAEANNRVLEEEEKLNELYRRKAEYENAYRECAQGDVDFAGMARFSQAVDTMQQYIKRQIVSVNVAKKNLDLARGRLNEAIQDRKTHEKLKENAFEEFKQELNDQEKKEIDELVSYKYNNKEDN